jgi:hypothetical protein
MVKQLSSGEGGLSFITDTPNRRAINPELIRIFKLSAPVVSSFMSPRHPGLEGLATGHTDTLGSEAASNFRGSGMRCHVYSRLPTFRRTLLLPSSGHLECDVVCTRSYLPTFRINLLPPFSGSLGCDAMHTVDIYQRFEEICCYHLQGIWDVM